MNKVAILLSTYNGEKYLREQINSILSQANILVDLYVRDDGSTDRTVDIIKEFQDNHNNIILYKGKNLGVGNSFMELVYLVPLLYDFYAFADQDDIWLSDKLRTAVDILKIKDFPACYCSNQTLIDKYGNFIRERYVKPIDTKYTQILCYNEVTGCTMVWNKQLQMLLTDEKRHPSKILLHKRIHDVWVAMVTSVVGEICYDKNSYILYRQHENNVVGVRKRSAILEWKKKIVDPTLRNGRKLLAEEIANKFGDIIENKSVLSKLQQCANYQKDFKGKMKLCSDIEIRKCSKENYFMYRIKVLLNLF